MLTSMLLVTLQQQLQPEGKESKLVDTTVTQAAVKQDEEPKPVTVAPLQRKG